MADLDNFTVEKLIRAIETLTDQLGRGAGGKSNSRVPGGAKTGTSGSGALDKASAEVTKTYKAYKKMLDDGIKLSKEQQKQYKDLKKQIDGLDDSIESATDATDDLEKSMRNAKYAQEEQSKSLKRFGKEIFTGSGSFGDAFGNLARGLDTYGGIANKALFGFATGVSFALTAMSDFAKSAADVGSFADLSAFSVGSVKQAKLLSGLGDSFTKVLAESNGGFKAFGKGSQDATENLAQLARGFRSGTWWVSSSIKKNLGPEFTKDIDRAAAASASLGLSTEDTANLMGSLAMSISLNSKNERDAQQKLVKQYADTVTASRNLSDAFGISAKDILAAMADFRKTQAGQVAGLEGNVGAQNLAPLIKAMGIESDPDKIAKIALAISQGDMAKAQYNVSNPAAIPLLQKLFESTQGTGGGADTETLNKNLRSQQSWFENFSKERRGSFGLNDEYAAPGVAAGVFAERMKKGAEGTEADKKAKENLGTTEADNIKTMEQLTSAINSLRNVILGLTAGFLGFTGILAPLVAGGLGAILMGGSAGISKIGGLLGSAFSTVADSKLGKVVGGVFSKGAGAAGGVANKIGGSAIGKVAGGMFDKLGGAASKGMSVFGDFLGGLGDNKTVKGAATLALLGGALALASHGFKEFGEVKWEGILKGTIAMGGLIILAKFVGEATTSMVKGAAAIAVLGAAMWVAGKGFQTFNDIEWEGILKGVVALTAFGVAAGVMGMFLPEILLGSVAIIALGAALAVFGAGAYLAAKAAEVFAGALKTIAEVNGVNLIAIGAGLAAIGAGMLVFTAGMIVGTASSVITGIMSLFGAKSPLDRIKEFVPLADKISMIGDGILHFGQGIVQINSGLKDFNSDALKNFRDQLIEFAKAGASDEVKLTAQYLTAIGTALTSISKVGDIKLPSAGDMSIPNVPDVGNIGANGYDNPSFNKASMSNLTPEMIAQVMAYLSDIHSDLSAIRSNTRVTGSDAPVRLS